MEISRRCDADGEQFFFFQTFRARTTARRRRSRENVQKLFSPAFSETLSLFIGRFGRSIQTERKHYTRTRACAQSLLFIDARDVMTFLKDIEYVVFVWRCFLRKKKITNVYIYIKPIAFSSFRFKGGIYFDSTREKKKGILYNIETNTLSREYTLPNVAVVRPSRVVVVERRIRPVFIFQLTARPREFYRWRPWFSIVRL